MLSRATTAAPWGIEAVPVHVEVDVRRGLPGMHIVGLPDTAVRESRERVRGALHNCGFRFRPAQIVVNLAPADLRKAGNQLDLAIALALLSAREVVSQQHLEGRLLCGELGLDGGIRPVRGGLAISSLASRLGLREVLLPASNAGEAAVVEGTAVVPVASLPEAVEHLVGVRRISPAAPRPERKEDRIEQLDLGDVRGQESAKRALEIAAAGGHNLLLVGPPGSGKTMLARRLPGVLPQLTHAESLEVTKIRSIVSPTPPAGLVWQRPFRSPHSSTSTAGLIGGGTIPRPGEVTLAHQGVLFLDELPEFQRASLEALRQPLEDRVVSVVRAQGRYTFPASFTLVASMNPCRCGHLGDAAHECRCSPHEVARYRNRISGPLLDRIDLQVEVPAVTMSELKGRAGEPTEIVADRVAAAREVQRTRLAEVGPVTLNASLPDGLLRRHCRLTAAPQKLLDAAFERLGLSARAVSRVLKVARTIADLRGADEIGAPDVAEAIQYRALDRRLAD